MEAQQIGRGGRFAYALLLSCVAAAFVAACSSGDGSAPPTVAAAETPAGGPAIAAAPQDEPKEFGKVQEEKRLVDQKNEILFRSYMQSARRWLDVKDFKRAEESVLQALAVKKNDPGAIELFQQVMGLQGEAVSSLEDTVRMVQNRRMLARQQQQTLVKEAYTKATHAESRNDYEAARIELENAELIMRFDPYETDFGTSRKDVSDLLAFVRRKLDTARKTSEASEFEEAYKKLRSQEEAALRARQEEVRSLVVAAIESFRREDFDNSEHQAERVLVIEPGNQRARDLVEASRQARHAVWRRDFFNQRREQFERWLVDIREAQIPVTALLTYPDADTQRRINARAKLNDIVDQAAQDTPEVAAIRSKLENETVSFDFGETPTKFKDVVKHIRNTTGINVFADPEVMTEKGEEDVNLTLRDYPLGKALRILLNNLKLDYVLRDSVLNITTADKALGKPLPRVYEVRDLTVSLPNFKAPNLNLRPGGAGEAAVKAILGEEKEPFVETDIGRLVDLIRENVGAGTWELEGRSINPSAGKIVATTTPQVHKQIERFLDDLRKFNKLTVHVEARFLNVTKAFLSEFGIDFRGLGGASPGTVATLDDVTNGIPGLAGAALDNGQPGLPAGGALHPTAGGFFNDSSGNDIRARTENVFNNVLGSILNDQGGATFQFSILDGDVKIGALLRAVEKNIDQTLVNAPRLTIYNRQRANLSLINQVSYVKDYDVEVAQTAFIADPLVDVVQDGLTLDVKPTVSYDRKYVQLDLLPTVATLTRPIRTFQTSLSGLTTPVIIELPEVAIRSAATTVTVPDNGWVVIGGLKQVSTVDRRSETPILSQIPIIGLLFSKKGRSDEIRDLIIILHVRIVDLTEEEKNLAR